MWRCTNGRPNHATEWWVRAGNYQAPDGCHLAVTPFLWFASWRKSALADPRLGVSSSSLSFGVEWWKWSVWVMIGKTTNSKTHDQIDWSKFANY
jgi:hypothetical protein